MKTVFINADVISSGKLLPNHGVRVEDGKITRVAPSGVFGESRALGESGFSVIDAQGNCLSAGLIDLHVHGGMNHDFMDGTREAIEGIAAYHSRRGITSMLATTAAADDVETFAFLDMYEECADAVKSLRYLGVHLEGPYLSPSQCGAIDPKYIRDLDPAHYEPLLQYNCIKRVSAAPERVGGLAFGELLRGKGIIASQAHTDADFDQAVLAMEHGYTSVTHLYSCTIGVHRKNAFRHGGLIEAALLLDGLTAEIIADGCHLPACILKLIYKCKGKEGIILTSDAMRGAGLKDGQMTKIGSKTQGQDVIIEDGVAKMLDRQFFAGSVASGDRLIRTMINEAGVTLPDAITMMTITPARMMGLSDTIGDVREGMEADLIVFDENINIKHVMVKGKIIGQVE